MQDRRAARRYANALFLAAQAGGTVKAVESDLALIVGLIHQEADFRDFLVAPYSSREQKIALLTRVFGGATQPVTLQLLTILIEKGREAEIGAVYDEYVILRRVLDKVAHVVVTSSEGLDKKQQDAIVARLGTILSRKIEPEFAVDAAIGGGVRVKYENLVLDGSVQGALNRMKDKLRHDVLKQA